MLRGIVQIGCHATFADLRGSSVNMVQKATFTIINMVDLDPFCLFLFKKEERIPV